MDIAGRLRQLEGMVAEAKGMPLSSSVILNREELMEALEGIRQALPEEIKHARLVVKDREQLLAKARRDAEGIIQEGLSEQRRLASREAVVRKAREEADRIVREAEERARTIRAEAEDYVDAKLASFEAALGRLREELARALEEGGAVQELLARTTKQVERGREHLRSGPPTPEQPAAGDGP